MKRIRLVTVGGTISSVRQDGVAGSVPSRSGAELLDGVPIPEGAVVDAETFRLVPSTVLTASDRRAIATRILEIADEGSADAIVVSQGTDTIEETAFALELYRAAADLPVVVTGAMRDASSPSPDGQLNLADALAAAASGATAGAGVCVVFDGAIHAARWVGKATTFRSAGFSSEPLGPVGLVTEGRARLWLRPIASPGFRIPQENRERAESIALIIAAPGDPLRYLDSLSVAETAAAVIVGMGGGHVAEAAMPAVSRLAARIPVVVASRVGSGPVLTGTYGYVGSEVSLRAAGCVMAGALSAEHAAVLLEVLIASGAGRTQIADVFAEFDES